MPNTVTSTYASQLEIIYQLGLDKYTTIGLLFRLPEDI